MRAVTGNSSHSSGYESSYREITVIVPVMRAVTGNSSHSSGYESSYREITVIVPVTKSNNCS